MFYGKNRVYFYLTFLVLLFPLFNVSSMKTENNNKETIINISDYNYPNPSNPDAYRIVLFGTNDIHGRIFPRTFIQSSPKRIL